jgi:hypothetical protein
MQRYDSWWPVPMDRSSLIVLQAASQILNEERPDRQSVEILTTYAETNLPDKANLPLDELATVVAMKLMDVGVPEP